MSLNEKVDSLVDEFTSINNSVKNIFSPQIQVFEPFGAHVDPSRSNMSAKQILQTVTSRMNDIPFILNKTFRDFTEIKSPFVFRAPKRGTILSSKFNILFIVFHNDDGTDTNIFEYIPPIKKIQAQALHLRFVRETGSFNVGDLLYDYTGQTENGLPKIGYRTKVLFGSFLGYTAEDAMVISESYSKRAQIDYSEKLYIPIAKKLKYFPNENGNYFYKVGECQKEQFIKYIKIDPSINYDSQLINATEKDSRYYLKYIEGLEGAEVKELKLHKINKESFQSVAEEYIYSPLLIKEISEIYGSIINDYNEMVKEYKKFNLSGQNIPGLVTSIFNTYFSTPKLPAKLVSEIAEKYGLIDKDIDYVLEIDICQTVPTVLGDKFANCFAGKGTISMIVPDHLMPKDEDGKPVDLIFNPLGIYGRNNWGSIFELGLTNIIRDLERTIYKGESTKELVKEKILLLDNLFISKIDKEYSSMINYMMANWDYYYSYFTEDVKKNKLYINVDNFPEFPYEKFYNEFIKPYAEKYNLVVDKRKYIFSKELAEFVEKTRGYTINGLEEHQDIETEAYFGDSYYLKLFHTANSKYNAVSIAKTYNKVNGQPAKGRKRNGGQHISWMTEAAILGHCDNPVIGNELKTVKSDCIPNKDKFILDMIYTGSYSMKESGYDSKTFETLNHFLAAQFGMKFGYIGEAVETSKATEQERIANRVTKEEISIDFADFKKNSDIIFNDFELNDLDLDSIIKEEFDEEKIDYFDDLDMKTNLKG